MRVPWAAWRGGLPSLPARAPACSGADPPCLVHLVWAPLGLEPLRAFADAMRRHPSGVEHELVLAMKGFASVQEAGPYLDEVADLAPEPLFFADRGFDLDVYFEVAARLRRDRYCFVNSYGRPLVNGWLALLDAALARPGVGQVGATGSWASMHSWVMHLFGLPSAYRGLFPTRREVRELLMGIQRERASLAPRTGLDGRQPQVSQMRARVRSLPRIPREMTEFEPFPTHHLRSNAFMVTHAALRELRLPVVRNKMDTHVLESGRESITAQLERVGLSSLVVDRAGVVHRPEQWDCSRTFWQGDQEYLLVADNQTDCYATGAFARRSLLGALAWGAGADPRPPLEDAPAAPLAGG